MKYRVVRDLTFIRSSNTENPTESLTIKIGEIVTAIPGNMITWKTQKWYSKICVRDDNNVRRIIFEYDDVIRTAVIGKDVQILLE
jgi:hypothetical protein